jgi:hypothetical protein
MECIGEREVESNRQGRREEFQYTGLLSATLHISLVKVLVSITKFATNLRIK